MELQPAERGNEGSEEEHWKRLCKYYMRCAKRRMQEAESLNPSYGLGSGSKEKKTVQKRRMFFFALGQILFLRPTARRVDILAFNSAWLEWLEEEKPDIAAVPETSEEVINSTLSSIGRLMVKDRQWFAALLLAAGEDNAEELAGAITFPVWP
jgi:hypothetical protein